ncbi:hypothetical protein M0813_02909 [Anaeramoeba flamelloides]|uniref:ARM repeat-containing protein n=1 Tax=Anaeramoeba flamelloides TaxID=1746091 RepID=A0ABQ8YEM2_9EUKA|nr:hypothetical protein M0813_02909 [Anaeramoeba flamelloides]
MTWYPNKDNLLSIYELLNQAQEGSTKIQQGVYAELERFNEELQDFNKYLLYIFLTTDENVSLVLQELAGLTLKNNLHFNDYDEIKYLQGNLLEGLKHPESKIRRTSGSVISYLISRTSFASCGDLFPFLSELLSAEEPIFIHSSLNCFMNLLEDNSNVYENDLLESKLDLMIEKTILLSHHELYEIRFLSLKCLIKMLFFLPDPLIKEFNNFLQHLIVLIEKEEKSIMVQAIAQCVNILISLHFSRVSFLIEEHLIPWMFQLTSNEEEELSLEGCRFWACFSEIKEAHKLLVPKLEELIPILLEKMIYTQQELIERDKWIEDEMQEGAWTIRKASAISLETIASVCPNEVLIILTPMIVPPLQKVNEINIYENDQEWLTIEVSILALGYIAPYCLNNINQYLDEIVPYLVKLILPSNNESSNNSSRRNSNNNNNNNKDDDEDEDEKKNLLKSVTFWSLSGYSSWIILNENQEYFELIVQSLIDTMKLDNEILKISSCSALGKLIQEDPSKFSELVAPILNIITDLIPKFESEPLLQLYSVIGILIENFNQEIINDENNLKFIKPLIKKWNSFSKEIDPDLIPLMDLFTAIVFNLGNCFLPFAEICFENSINLIDYILSNHIKLIEKHQQSNKSNNNSNSNSNSRNNNNSLGNNNNNSLSNNNERGSEEGGVKIENSDLQYAIYSFGFISNLIVAIQDKIKPLITNSNFLKLIVFSMKEHNTQLKRITFEIVANLSIYTFDVLNENIEEYLSILIQNLDHSFLYLFENSTWALGEIFLRYQKDLGSLPEEILKKMIQVFQLKILNTRIANSAASLISRLTLSFTDLVSNNIHHFINDWLIAISSFKDISEKQLSYNALLTLINVNPDSFPDYFLNFCYVIVNFPEMGNELAESFLNILNEYKKSLANDWQSVYEKMPKNLQIELKNQFHFC